MQITRYDSRDETKTGDRIHEQKDPNAYFFDGIELRKGKMDWISYRPTHKQ